MLSREKEGEVMSWRAMQELLLDLNHKVDCLLSWMDLGMGFSGHENLSKAHMGSMNGEKGSGLISSVGRKETVRVKGNIKETGLGFVKT